MANNLYLLDTSFQFAFKLSSPSASIGDMVPSKTVFPIKHFGNDRIRNRCHHECKLESAWIMALKKNPLEAVKKRVDHLLRENVVAVLPIVKVELLGGTKSKKEFEQLGKRLDSLIPKFCNLKSCNH